MKEKKDAAAVKLSPKASVYIPLLALAATLLCLVISIACFGIRYQLNDDAIISNIAAGAYGPETHKLVYVNVLFGWVLKPFYALFGSVNWFVVWLLAGGVLCFTALGTALVKKAGLPLGGILFVTFLLLVGVDFFHIFHYVKYAALFITTGLLLVALNLGKWNKTAVLGMALAVWGSMLRFQQFVAIGGLAAALLLTLFFRLDAAHKKRAACAVAAVVVLVLGIKGVDSLSYRQNPEWAHYMQFNALRTQISDYSLQYATPEDLAKLGYTITDYEMLDTWNFYDSDVFDLEALQGIVDNLPGNTFGNAVRQTVAAGLKMLYGRPVYMALGAVLLGWLVLSGRKRWPAFIGTLAVLGAEVFYLHWRGRFPDTIEFSLALAALVFCAACYEDTKKDTRFGVLCCAILLLCSVPGFIGFKDAANEYWETRPARAAEFEAAIQDKDTLYLADAQLVDAANGYNVWQARPKDYFSNIVFTGSWLMQSPFQRQVLHNFGMDNLYKDSIGREDVVYLETVYRELKEDYLRQHYAPAVQLVKVQDGAIVSGYCAVLKDE